MITLKNLCNDLEDLLESTKFSDYCPNGLQVEGSQEINCIATGVSASLETIQKAIEKKADVLLVHHGIFWKNDDFCITANKRKKIALLLKNNISLIAYHLPLDAHRTLGNNWKAAMDHSWGNLEPFGESNGQYIGVKGSFPEISRQDFQKKLENYYQHPAHTALFGKEKISTAALISGGAHREIQEAVREGVDSFITGSFDEPIWSISQEESMNFFAMGHSATEVIGPKAIGEYLEKKYRIEQHFINVINPF